MPLKLYSLLEDDTRLVRYLDTVYKVKVKYEIPTMENMKLPFTKEEGHNEIEDVLRAVFYINEREGEFRPIHTPNFLITPVKKAWGAAKHFGFRQDDEILETYPYVFEFTVNIREDVIKTSKRVVSKATEESRRCSNKTICKSYEKVLKRIRVKPKGTISNAEGEKTTENTSGDVNKNDQSSEDQRVALNEGQEDKEKHVVLDKADSVKKQKVAIFRRDKEGKLHREVDVKSRAEEDGQYQTSHESLSIGSLPGVQEEDFGKKTKHETKEESKKMEEPDRKSRQESKSPKRSTDTKKSPWPNPQKQGTANEGLVEKQGSSTGHKKKVGLDSVGSASDSDRRSSRRTSNRISMEKVDGDMSGCVQAVEVHSTKRIKSPDRTVEVPSTKGNKFTDQEGEVYSLRRNKSEGKKVEIRSMKRNKSLDTVSSTSVTDSCGNSTRRKTIPSDLRGDHSIRKGKKYSPLLSPRPLRLSMKKMKVPVPVRASPRLQLRSDTNNNSSVMKRKPRDTVVVSSDERTSVQNGSFAKKPRLHNRSEEQIINPSQKHRLKEKLTENGNLPSSSLSDGQVAQSSSERRTLRQTRSPNQSPQVSHVKPVKRQKLDNDLAARDNSVINVQSELISSETSTFHRSNVIHREDETGRLTRLRLRSPPEVVQRGITLSQRRDRHLVEQEELAETMKLQNLAQSSIQSRRLRRSPRFTTEENIYSENVQQNLQTGFWGFVKEFITTPVKGWLEKK